MLPCPARHASAASHVHHAERYQWTLITNKVKCKTIAGIDPTPKEEYKQVVLFKTNGNEVVIHSPFIVMDIVIEMARPVHIILDH